MKYAICLSSGIYNTDENNVVIAYETYTEAKEQLDNVDPYGHVSRVEVIVKPTIGKTKDIRSGLMLSSRFTRKPYNCLMYLAIILIKNNEVPQEFKNRFKTVIEVCSVNDSFISELRRLMVQNNESALVVIREMDDRRKHDNIYQHSDLFLVEEDQFYKVLKFRATTKHTNDYTLFDLDL